MDEINQGNPNPAKRNPFTKVTSLSKILALILFISLPFIGFKLGIKYQRTITVQTDKTSPSTTQDSSKKIVTETTLPKVTQSFFVSLSPQHLQKVPGITLQPDSGYVLTTSILSQDRNKVAYAEVSECLTKSPASCDWTLNLFIKDLTTQKNTKVYSHSAKGGTGDMLAYFPIYWSKNDKKIILEYGNPTDGGMGGSASLYWWASLDANTKEIKDLAPYAQVFINDYENVIYSDNSDKSPKSCGQGAGGPNYGKIVMKNINNDQVKVLVEEDNSYYQNLKLVNSVLTYDRFPVGVDSEGCSIIDWNSKPESKFLISF